MIQQISFGDLFFFFNLLTITAATSTSGGTSGGTSGNVLSVKYTHKLSKNDNQL